MWYYALTQLGKRLHQTLIKAHHLTFFTRSNITCSDIVQRSWSIVLPWWGLHTDHTSMHLQPFLALCDIIRWDDDPRPNIHSTHTNLSLAHTSNQYTLYTQCCLEALWLWCEMMVYCISVCALRTEIHRRSDCAQYTSHHLHYIVHIISFSIYSYTTVMLS